MTAGFHDEFILYSAEAVSVPGCQAVAPVQVNLNNVSTTSLRVPEAPFGVTYASEDVALVSLNESLGVLNTTTFKTSLLRSIPLPFADLDFTAGGAQGLSLTPNRRHLLVTSGTGALVVDVARAIAGSSDAVVSLLVGPAIAGTSVIEVTITEDVKYAFVSQEHGTNDIGIGNVEVFRLYKATANGTVPIEYVGYLGLGEAVIGTALSPDGSLQYATSEIREGVRRGQGSINVIDVKLLEKDPSKALVSNATAGCGAVRVIVSADGKTVWITARESNHLLAFDAAKLISNRDETLLASVQVGTSPVGLTFAKNESLILTADSNRFKRKNATTGLSVVDVKAALAGEPAVFGRIETGVFPREFAVSPECYNPCDGLWIETGSGC